MWQLCNIIGENTFSRHCKSNTWHKSGNFKISEWPCLLLLFFAGALPIIYITLLCYPFCRRVAMLAYLLLSGYGVYCALRARSNVHRLRSFAWQALFRFVLFMLRLIGAGRGSPASLRLYLSMDMLALLGGLVNISRLPECFSPGRFDYWCNSHQIMHIMVILSIVHLHWGMLEDLTWLKGFHCP